MEKKTSKSTIILNEEQQNKFKEFVKNEFNLKNQITDDEISLYIKAMILKYTGEVDFLKELEEIGIRITRDKKLGEVFVLNELFSKEEWENKKFFKMILGRMFYNKCKDKEYSEKLGVIPDGKNVRDVQQYKKVK